MTAQEEARDAGAPASRQDAYWAKAEAGTLTPDDICDQLLDGIGGPFSPPFSAAYIEQMRDLMKPNTGANLLTFGSNRYRLET